jgi:hypothetical protein
MKISVIGLHACGLLSTLAVIFSFLLAVPTFGVVHTALNRRGYHPATFVVERVVYRPGTDRDGIDLDTFWAEGKVEGRDEKLSLQDFVTQTPASQEQLEGLVTPGQAFSVLYNPSESPVMVQGRYLRVLKYEANLDRSLPRRAALFVLACYGPVLLMLVFFVPFWLIAEPSHRRLALVWLVFDAAGLGVQAFGVLLFLMLPTLERHLGHG